MKKVLFMAVLAVLLGSGGAAAQYNPWAGAFLPFGGSEVGRVVAGNQAMVWSLASQAVWQPWGFPGGQQVVCKPMSVGHRFADMALGAMLGGGSTAIWSRDAGAIAGGASAGFGGVGLFAQHERDCQLVSAAVSSAMADPSLVRINNPNQTMVWISDGARVVGTVGPMDYGVFPPATVGFSAVLDGIDGKGLPAQVPAEIVQPDPGRRELEIRPSAPAPAPQTP